MRQEKNLELSLLLDLYGPLLTERQRKSLELYYNLDYSLGEIAALTGASRQAAQDAIRRGEARLKELEDCLRLRSRYDATQAAFDKLEKLAEAGDRGGVLAEIQRARNIWEDL